MENERERELSPEENDQLSRSTKNMKCIGDSATGSDGVEAMDVSSPRAPNMEQTEYSSLGVEPISY